MFECIESVEQFYELITPSKITTRAYKTVSFMTGKVREDNLPGQPTPRRAALASTRKIIKAI